MIPIRQIATALGYTRRPWARDSGVSDGTLAPEFAYGRTPHPRTMCRLLPALRRKAAALPRPVPDDVAGFLLDPYAFCESPAALSAPVAGATPPGAMEETGHEEKENAGPPVDVGEAKASAIAVAPCGFFCVGDRQGGEPTAAAAGAAGVTGVRDADVAERNTQAGDDGGDGRTGDIQAVSAVGGAVLRGNSGAGNRSVP